MKKQLFLFILMLLPMLASAEDVRINDTTFPDSIFRNWVLSQDYGADGVLTNEELENVTSLNVRHKGIYDLKGIEYFTSLKVLICLGNQLTTLDVSGCTELDTLACSSNQLIALNVSMNTKLISLECYGNQLSTLDLSKNTALRRIHCNANQLTSLDVSKNTALIMLQCSSNLLTTLDVTKNSAMTSLSCTDNKLTTLYVSNNKSLESIICFNNQLTSLDASGCSALKTLSCTGNQLTTLDLSGCSALEEIQCNDNQLATLDLSENTVLTKLFCYHNQIKGAGMDALVESLPTMGDGSLTVLYFVDEQNVMTNAQVAAAKAKGWTPYIRTYGFSEEYAGLETTTECFPEGTKWTEIRLDTLKYDSWYSRVDDEWVPNFETIEYYVKGEYPDRDWIYKKVYTNGPEWTDSLTLLIQEVEQETYEDYNCVRVSVLTHDYDGEPYVLWPGEAYQFDWIVGKELYYEDITMSNTTSLVRPRFYYGIIDEIKEGFFGGVKPLKYVDLDGKAPEIDSGPIRNASTKGGRIIQGIGITEWNDGECLLGPPDPYSALSFDGNLYPERHYRSMLVHFERNGEVLYDVWPKKDMAYHPMIEDGKVWKVGTIPTDLDTPVQIVDHYYFDGDTIIDGKICKQMMCQHYTSPNYPYYENLSQPNYLRFVGAWYEEDQKVYLYDERTQSMVIKYDFSLEANDTLQFLNWDGYPPFIIGPKQTGGIEGFKGVYRDIMMCTDEGQNIHSTFWLEGVGDIDGPTRIPIDPILDDPVPEFLMSCTVGDEVIYLNDRYADGASPAGVRKDHFDFTHTPKIKPKTRVRSEEDPSLYGEYNDQQLDINLGPLDDTYQVYITNESGKAVYEKTINAGNIVGLNIDISSYAKGRYTVTVENSSESFIGEFETLTTGISDAARLNNKGKMKNDKLIYNLQGQRLSRLQKGLNIVNGRKIYVKD